MIMRMNLLRWGGSSGLVILLVLLRSCIVVTYSLIPHYHVFLSSRSLSFTKHIPVKSSYFTTQLSMSDESESSSIFDQMRAALGNKQQDNLPDMEKENRQALKGLRDLDRDPSLKVNNRFIEWLGDNGVWVKTVSAWGRAPHPLVISSNTEVDGESCGRGILARESMGEGELMMTIPFDICFTKQLAQEKLGYDIIDDDMDEYIAIALLLMIEKLKGSESKWKPYFDILPTVENVNPSFIWTEEELEYLKGSPTYYASISLRNKVVKEYENLKNRKLSIFASRLPSNKITPDLFLWSFVMLFSRAARLSSKQGGEELALVPYADLMNHNPYSNTYIDAQKSGMPLFSRKEEVAVYADRSYKKFEQIFINYGDKGNGDLLLLYGFALDRNPFDSVDITIGLSKEDPLYDQKKKYLEKSGKDVLAARFPLQRDRYPSELVDFLRLLLVEAEDLAMQSIDSLNFNEPITPSIERRVLTTIIEICESYLIRYPSSLEEDEILIADRKLFQLLTRQQRMAVKLRVSEKRILKQTIKAIQEEIDKLPKIVIDGKEIMPAGRSFDSLKSSTVRKPKTLEDVVERRGQKEENKDNDGSNEKTSIAERRRRRRTASSSSANNNDDDG